MGELVGKWVTLGAAMAPVAAAFAAIMFVVSPIITGVAGIVTTIWGLIQITGALGGMFKKVFGWFKKPLAWLGKKLGFLAKRFGSMFKPLLRFIIPRLWFLWGGLKIAIIGFGKAVIAFFAGITAPVWGIVALVVAVIAAIVVAVVVWRKEIVEFGKAAWKWMGEVWDKIKIGVSKFLTEAKNNFAKLWVTLKADFNSLIDFFSSIPDYLAGVWSRMQVDLKRAWESIEGDARWAWDGMGAIVDAFVDATVAFFDIIVKISTEAWNSVWNSATTIFGGIRETITGFIDFVKEAFHIFSSTAEKDGIFAGLTSAATFVIDTVKDKFTTLAESIKNIFFTIFTKIKGLAKSILPDSFIKLMTKAIGVFDDEDEAPKSGPFSGAPKPTYTPTDINQSVETTRGVKEAVEASNAAKTRDSVVTTQAAKSFTQIMMERDGEGQSKEVTFNSYVMVDGKEIGRATNKYNESLTTRAGGVPKQRKSETPPKTGTMGR
jgi:phage-related protein